MLLLLTLWTSDCAVILIRVVVAVAIAVVAALIMVVFGHKLENLALYNVTQHALAAVLGRHTHTHTQAPAHTHPASSRDFCAETEPRRK